VGYHGFIVARRRTNLPLPGGQAPLSPIVPGFNALGVVWTPLAGDDVKVTDNPAWDPCALALPDERMVVAYQQWLTTGAKTCVWTRTTTDVDGHTWDAVVQGSDQNLSDITSLTRDLVAWFPHLATDGERIACIWEARQVNLSKAADIRVMGALGAPGLAPVTPADNFAGMPNVHPSDRMTYPTLAYDVGALRIAWLEEDTSTGTRLYLIRYQEGR
jgi:hypothetical protein